jgi:hypothetical protein
VNPEGENSCAHPSSIGRGVLALGLPFHRHSVPAGLTIWRAQASKSSHDRARQAFPSEADPCDAAERPAGRSLGRTRGYTGKMGSAVRWAA